MNSTMQAFAAGPVQAAALQELRPRGPHTRSKKNKGKRPQQGG